MLDCFSTLAHGLWVCIEALQSLEQMLMFPSRNPPLWPGRALGFERTILTGRGPVAPQHLAVFFVCIAIRQSLSSWTAIGVLLWQIGKPCRSPAMKNGSVQDALRPISRRA
jgi:hypothetical protein